MWVDGWASLSTFGVGVFISVDPEYTDGWSLVFGCDLGLFGFMVSVGAPKDAALEGAA